MVEQMDKTYRPMRVVAGGIACLGIIAVWSCAAQNQAQQWEVHDPDRPQPPVVVPGTFSSQQEPGKPPSDAIVLFDGKDLSKWRGERGPAEWKVENGYMEVTKEKVIQDGKEVWRGKGAITTKESFGDCQLHVEFMCPDPPRGSGQARGNSGIFLMDRYEIQVLDGYQNKTYADGLTGCVYGQYPPLVNACRPPGQWNVYDIIWRRPRFSEDGKVLEPARVTVLLNGVVVQDATEVRGATVHRALPKYSKHPDKAPISLQDHGDPVRFRNIWVRPLPEEKPVPATLPPTKYQ